MNTKKGSLLSLVLVVGAMLGGANSARAQMDQPNNRLAATMEETSNDLPECADSPWSKAVITSERACQMSQISPAMTYTLQIDIAAGKRVQVTTEGCPKYRGTLVLNRDYREEADLSDGGTLTENHGDFQLISGMTIQPGQDCSIKFEPVK